MTTTTITTTPCQCESVHHFPVDELPTPELRETEGAGTGHADQAVPAGQHRAWWVGPVCDDCAATHMAPYLVTPASQMRESTSQGRWVTLADAAATRLGGGPQVVEAIADSYEAAESAAESARRAGRGASVYRPFCGHSVNRYAFRADLCQQCESTTTEGTR